MTIHKMAEVVTLFGGSSDFFGVKKLKNIIFARGEMEIENMDEWKDIFGQFFGVGGRRR
jgi:hypothetical protein